MFAPINPLMGVESSHLVAPYSHLYVTFPATPFLHHPEKAKNRIPTIKVSASRRLSPSSPRESKEPHTYNKDVDLEETKSLLR